MKKQIAFLLSAILLVSCNVPAPPQSSTVLAPNSGASSKAESTSQSSAESLRSPADTNKDQAPPMPDKMPDKTKQALDLPKSLATKSEGWTAEQVTPAQYNFELSPERAGVPGFINVDVFFDAQDNRLTLFNANGKQISETGEYDNNDGVWHTENGMVTIKQDGLYGLANAATGEIVVQPKYAMEVVVYDDTYYGVSEADQTQKVIRQSDLSTVLTVARGERHERLGKDYWIVYQSGTLKVLEHDGTPVKNMVCDEYLVVGHDSSPLGVNRIVIRDGNKWGMYDESLNPITNSVYDQFNYSFKGDYISFIKSGKHGVMDYSGKVSIEPKWDDIILYENSASLCRNNKWTATMDLSKEVTDVPVYDFVADYSENGFASFEKGGKFGLLDDDGNVVITPRYSDVIYAGNRGFDDNVFLVSGENGPGSYGIISGGQMVLPKETLVYQQGNNPYYSEDESYNLVGLPNGKWGYVDSQGQYVIDAKFDTADSFIKDRNVAMVLLDGKICLIDRKGNIVLETIFTDCLAFSPETMVCAMRYTDASGNTADCLVRLISQQ